MHPNTILYQYNTSAPTKKCCFPLKNCCCCGLRRSPTCRFSHPQGQPTGTIFNDTFEVYAVNPEHKVFDKIDRLKATAETYDCELTLDVNSDLWKVKEHQKIVLQLASSLTGTVDDGTYRQSDEATLLDMVSSLSPPTPFFYDRREKYCLD
jgi:hypothetical protein